MGESRPAVGGRGGRRRPRNAILIAVLFIPGLLSVLVLSRIAAQRRAAVAPGGNSARHGEYFGRTQPPEEDILRFTNGAEPEMLDPGLISGQPDGRIVRCLFEGLVRNHPQTLDPIPGVARAWELSDGGRTYTFHLRRDAHWTNGQVVTAHDFEWSWLRVLRPETPARYADLFYLIRNGKPYKKREISDASQVGIRAVDDTTLVVELEAPTPYFLQLLTYYPFLPVPRQVVERCGDRWTLPKNIVTNGAFRLVEHRVNDCFVMDRFDRYWGAKDVRLKRLVAYTVEDLSTILNLYRAGMTDWNPSGYLPAQYIPYVEKYADYRAGAYLATNFYSFNVTKPPLDNKLVRQALAFAVDRERITKYLLHDSKTPWGNVVPPGFEGYAYPVGARFDPEKARLLLAQAGYPEGHGFPSVEILFNTSEDHRQLAEAIQDMWKRNLGIDVRLGNQEFGSYMKTVVGLQYQVARRSWIADYKDPNTFLYILRTGDGNNRTGWGDPHYDALLEAAGREMDPAKRYAILAEAEALALDAMPFLPIYAYQNTELVAPYVRGLYPTALDFHPLEFVYFERGKEVAGR